MPYKLSRLPAHLGLLALAWTTPMRCQGPTGQGATGTAEATSIPLSGRNNSSGSVQTQQSVNSGGGISTVTSSVQLSGPVSGSIRKQEPGTGPIQLSLEDAVKRALAANLSPITSANSVTYAKASRLQSLSSLLPNVSVAASETVTQVNLAAYGLSIQLPASTGFSIPTVVGPYQYSQLQGQVSQSVLNFVQRRNYQGSKESERSAGFETRDARELLVEAVAGTYLQTVAAAARVTSQQAQVENAEAIYKQAQVRKEAGVNARIDVTRSIVELQTQQQRLNALVADLSKQKIGLARLIGTPLDRELQLNDTFDPAVAGTPDDGSAVQAALQKRWSVKAAESQVRVAELAVAAARAERYPSFALSGNYGVIGPTPASQHGVFAVTGSVTVPVYAGGRFKADLLQAETALRQRRAELMDEQGRVEGEVRTALIELRTAEGQVKLAASNRSYASETLEEARDRFAAGVATTVEVVQAQEQVAGAENDYVSSLFSFHLAKLSLDRATGELETRFAGMRKGNTP